MTKTVRSAVFSAYGSRCCDENDYLIKCYWFRPTLLYNTNSNVRNSTSQKSSNPILQILGNGYIEGTELDGFLREFVSSANFTDIAPEVNLII